MDVSKITNFFTQIEKVILVDNVSRMPIKVLTKPDFKGFMCLNANDYLSLPNGATYQVIFKHLETTQYLEDNRQILYIWVEKSYLPIFDKEDF